MKRLCGWMIAIMLLGGSSVAGAVPPIAQAQLSNGARVLLMEAHNVPMVSLQLVLPAGSRFDPAGKGGTASLMAAMLTDHTAKHDQLAFADLLDADAIKLGAGVDREALHVSLTTLDEAFQSGLDSLAEGLLQPGWDKKRFKIIKHDAIAASQKALEEPRTRAAAAAAALLFAGHPYGHLSDGDVDSLKRIKLADLRRLYRQQVKPQEAVFAVSGDITMKALLPLLEARFAGWQGKPKQRLGDIQPAAAVTGQRVDVALPTSQMMVQLLRLGPSRSDADFFPAYLLNHMLGGGGFGSRLMEEVREKRGLTYGVYSYFQPMTVPGPFVITLQTRADQADKAEQVVRDVLKEMYAGKISAKQLKASKENLMGSFAQKMDSNRERVGLMAMIGLYHLPLDYLAQWTHRVQQVRLAQVKAVAKRYLDPAAWNRVRVGPVQGQ